MYSMSYDTAKRQNMWGKKPVFSGWMVDNVDAKDIADNQSPSISNCRIINWNIEKRSWRKFFVESITGSNEWWTAPTSLPPASLTTLVVSNEWYQRIFARLNISEKREIFSFDENADCHLPSTWLCVKWGISHITKWATDAWMWDNLDTHFIAIGNNVYFFSKDIDMWKIAWWTATTATYPTTWLTKKLAFSEVFNSSHRAAWWEWENIVYKSVADSYEDFSGTWSDNFTFKTMITWLKANNQALFIFTATSISVIWKNDIVDTSWTVSYITRELEVKEWAIHNKSIVTVWNNLYFITPSNKIKIVAPWWWDIWFDTIDLSHKEWAWIADFLDALPNHQSSVTWYYAEKQWLIKRFFKKERTDDYNNVCVIYNVNTWKFVTDDLEHVPTTWWASMSWVNYISWAALWTATSNWDEVYFYTEEDTWQYVDDLSETTDRDIWFEYRTKKRDMWAEWFKKLFWEIRTETEIDATDSELYQYTYIDWTLVDTKVIDTTVLASWLTWYQPVQIMRTKWNLNRKWNYIQLKFTSDVWAVRLRNINMKSEMLPAIATSLTKNVT